MSETTTNVKVETKGAAPDVVAVAPHIPTRAEIAWRVIEKFLFSTKLWITAMAIVYLRSDYWSDVKCISGFVGPNATEQLATFRQISDKKSDTLKYILMSFLGVTTAGQIMGVGGSVVNRFTQTTTQRAQTTNRNTRADREE